MKKPLLIIGVILLLSLLTASAILMYHKMPDSSTIFSKSTATSTDSTTPAPAKILSDLDLSSKGPAPDFQGATNWINGEPLTIAGLKDHVVLVNFWTYSNIQSIKLSEWLKSVQEKYASSGLVIIGVHTPQYSFEKVPAGVTAATERYHLPYAIALDNNYKIWQAYQNLFWPTTYLIDKQGNLVYSNIGETRTEETEQAIRLLLGLEGQYQSKSNETQTSLPDWSLGLIKLNRFGGTEKPNSNEQIYVFPKKLTKDRFVLEGKWSFSQESAMHTQGFGKLRLNFNAKKVTMVASSTTDIPIKISIDGQPDKGVVIGQAGPYELFDSEESKIRTMEIEIPRGGLEIFKFSFE